MKMLSADDGGASGCLSETLVLFPSKPTFEAASVLPLSSLVGEAPTSRPESLNFGIYARKNLEFSQQTNGLKLFN